MVHYSCGAVKWCDGQWRTDFVKIVRRFIRNNRLFETGPGSVARVLVALSGGLDSVALLHVLCKLGYDCYAAPTRTIGMLKAAMRKHGATGFAQRSDSRLEGIGLEQDLDSDIWYECLAAVLTAPTSCGPYIHNYRLIQK